MGYNRTRTKTCSYCYGNHSVMDCEKLQEDKIKSEAYLNDLSDVTLSSPTTGQLLIFQASGQFANVSVISGGTY